MKRTILIFAALVTLCGTAFAQKSVKFGHINSIELMQIMPGRDSAQTVLQKEAAELEEQMKLMQDELEQRYNNYQ